MALTVPPSQDSPLTGLGGTPKGVGRVILPVKVQKSSHHQTFMVVDSAIAGYDALLGQDCMAAVRCAIRITTDYCALEVGSDPQSLVARLQRPMHDSHLIHVCHSARPSSIASTVKSSSEVNFDAKILSIKQSHKFLPKYWGPFNILELIGRNAVRLDMPAHLNRILGGVCVFNQTLKSWCRSSSNSCYSQF
jgi:hypothetical protein